MSSLRNFDLNLLVLFEALISEAHVSRAAEKVFLSQSAMSHALNRLREQLNDPLLVRTRNGLRPTPRALDMLPKVRQALHLMELTISPPEAFDPIDSERHFKIAATDYFETVIFPDLFFQIKKQAPNLTIEIDLIAEDSASERLENGSIDLIVGMDAGQKLPEHLISEDWLKEHPVCVVCNNNDAIGNALDLDEYLQLQHILFFDVEGNTSSSIGRFLQKQGLERQYVSRTTNYMAAARMVVNSDAVVTLPSQMAKLFCQLLPLKPVQAPIGIPEETMTIVYHPIYENDTGIQWLKQQIKDFKLA